MPSLGTILIFAGLLAGGIAIVSPVLPPPTMLGAAIVTTDSVAYAWANPDGACDPSNISAYQRRLNNGMVVDIVLQNEAGPLGSDNIPGLTPFTNYTIDVRYVCADGRMSAFSAPLMFQTPQGMPSPPSITTVVPYPPTPFSALQIDWLAPTMPNGIIECYLVTVCEENQPSICPIMNNNVSATPDLFYIATGLTPDTSYSVTIVAKNGAAETLQHSDPDTASGMTDHGESSAPTNVIDTKVETNDIIITWTPPAMPNGMISFYAVMVSYGGQQRTEHTSDAMSTFIIIMGLDPFTNYTIRVAGINDFGTGNFSEPITVQTLEDVPSAPLNLNGVPSGATSAILAWDPPAMPNGVITAYTITFTGSTNPPSVPPVPGDTTTAEVTGLDPDAMVTFQVSANTSAGEGPLSVSISVDLPATDATPSAPRNLVGFPMPTSLRLTWVAPLFIGNLTHYVVSCMGPSPTPTGQTNGTETMFVVENLIPESTYTCSVTAVADATPGGSASDSFRTTTPELGAPMNVMATAISSTAIMLTWTHPMFMNTIDAYFVVWEQFGLPSGVPKEGGGNEIICDSFNTQARKRSVSPHMVRRKRTGFTFCTEVTSFNFTGLEEYINYNLTVFAINDAGNGARGFDTALTMPAAPRTPPKNLISPSQTHNSISVQWDSIPFLDQNGPNFRYAVSYRVFGNGDASLNVTAETNTITIQNLMSLTTYSIVIRAQNDIGVGRPSNTIQARTLAAPPGPVSNIMVTPNENGTAANITWTAAPLSDNNTEVNYTVMVQGPDGTVVSMETTSGTAVSVTQGLVPFVRYTVSIVAFTEGGNGPSITEAFYTLEGVPTGTVTNVAVESVDGGLRVTFDPITDPTVARGNVSYMVCYTTQTNATMVCEITQTSPIIISVPGNEVLNVTVAPFTAAGVGMSTGGVVFDTRPPESPGPLLTNTELVLVIVLCTVVPVTIGVAAIAIISAVICIAKGK